MLHFEGDRDFPLPPAELFAKLTDARFLVSCIPDVEKVAEQGPDRAVFTVRPNLGFVRGTLEVTLHVEQKTPPHSAVVVVVSKGVGSSSRVVAGLGLAAVEFGTVMHWSADIEELGGLLKMIPQGLIRGAAQKVLNDAWTAVEAKLRQTT